MAVPVIIAGAVGVIGAVGGAVLALVQALGQHPVLAYFLILAFFIVDGGISYGFNFQGLFGTLFTFVINQLGVPIAIYSWQLLILIAITPIVLYAVRATVQS
jgi:hypothetical protein